MGGGKQHNPRGIKLDLQLACAASDIPRRKDLRRWAAAALTSRRGAVDLTIRVVDAAESAQLNRTYRGRAGPTNVLSFPFEAPPGVQSPLLGDLVICAPVVAREATEQGKPSAAHWAHLVVHGVLHLLGHDHVEPVEAQAMEAAETTILARLGIPDPYRQSEPWAAPPR